MTMHTITPAPQAPVVPGRGRLRPLGLGDVRITGGFWADRQSVNGANTLAHIGSRLESEGWLPNFDLAVTGGLPAGRRGREQAGPEHATAARPVRRPHGDMARSGHGT